MKNIFLTSRFYKVMTIGIVLIAFTYFLPILFIPACSLVVIFLLVTIFDAFSVAKISEDIKGERKVLNKLSLGDFEKITYLIKNNSNRSLNCELYDEMPFQLQHRSSITNLSLSKQEETTHEFSIFPTERGEYNFENFYAFLSSKELGLIAFRKKLESPKLVKVFPSIIQMKKYAIQIFSKTASSYGIRRVRMIGENDEFEHIRNYVHGDNVKSINWKATSRKNELLVNQFQDSKSQAIYCIIDKGRCMQMPFKGLSLLDYSINAALVISNIILQKYDKAGLYTFSNTINTVITADNKQIQLETINQYLYNEETNFKESNYELLYFSLRQKVNRRSILFLFTNFDQLHEVQTNEAYIKAIAKKHLLVVISFINSELQELTNKKCTTKFEIYEKTIAQSLYNEKFKIMNLLSSYGAQVIITTPEKLNIDVINKYLEIKARRMK